MTESFRRMKAKEEEQQSRLMSFWGLGVMADVFPGSTKFPEREIDAETTFMCAHPRRTMYAGFQD